MDTSEVPEQIRQWNKTGVQTHPDLVRHAKEQGVTVLAGTDQPVGTVVDEILFLHDSGMSAHEAIGAACWTAREALGFPCLAEGDCADLIWFDRDPRQDLETLRAPSLVVIDGQYHYHARP